MIIIKINDIVLSLLNGSCHSFHKCLPDYMPSDIYYDVTFAHYMFLSILPPTHAVFQMRLLIILREKNSKRLNRVRHSEEY